MPGPQGEQGMPGPQNISDSEAITERGTYALDAREKNASIKGTLAYKITEQNTNLNTKQDKLTFDSTPTNGSSNPVTSAGVHTAILSAATPVKNSIIQDALHVDRNNPYADVNKPHLVIINNTSNMPTSMAGVRYVDYYDAYNIGVRIIGRNNNGIPIEFHNYYLDGAWRGWQQIGPVIQEVKTISNSGNVTLENTIGKIINVANGNVGKSQDECVGYSIQSGNTIYIGKSGTSPTDFVITYMPL